MHGMFGQADITNADIGIEIKSPSGKIFILNEEEEREFAIAALRQRMIQKMNRRLEIEKSLMNALAVGIGAYIVSMVLRKYK